MFARLERSLGMAMRVVSRNRPREFALDLARDDTWSWSMSARGAEVRCAIGVVMVTCEGDREDHVLSGGASFTARGPGRVAVWALEPARVELRARQDAAARLAPSPARSPVAGS
jgi:hypothetical protein